MAKHIDKVPSLEDFKAPWESDAGGDVEIDKPKLKKWIHNLITDKAKALDSRDDQVAKTDEVIAERDELKSEVDAKDPDASKKIAKAERERDEAKAEAKEATLRADRAEVAAEKGLTPKQAARLKGETKEELEADADEFLEELGVKPGEQDDDDDDKDDDEDETSGRTTPRSAVRLTNGGDTKNSADAEPDYEAIAAQISGNRIF